MEWNLENTYTRLPKHFYSEEKPVKPQKPEMVLFNSKLAEELGLTWMEEDKASAMAYLSGAKTPNNTIISQAYAGHQFGYFTMLGDGRAILLGELASPVGKRIDIQLKGSGRTKYSRNGDGRATLYSMLREYLISESMHFLGIPTTRSLAVVKNGIPVFRETQHEGAVLTRIAASHIRTGTFEYARHFGSTDDLQKLLDSTVERHFPEIAEAPNKALEFLKAVMLKQIDLIVHWMRVGFIHGVMNTDNMSISGETIDYGPCAFMNAYNPNTVFSSIDRNGRYAFGNQAQIAGWNTSVLAGALLPLIDVSEDKAIDMANELLKTYNAIYSTKWYAMMLGKIGVAHARETDNELIDDLLKLLNKFQPDYTHFFLNLENDHFADGAIYVSEEFKTWATRRKQRIEEGQTAKDAQNLMHKMNPGLIPRNHLVEDALKKAAEGNMQDFNSLLDKLKKPYSRNKISFKFEKIPLGFDENYQTFCGT